MGFLGNKNYGGWLTDTSKLNEKSIVYSFGVGQDISWDRELIERTGCHVFAFDPTPSTIAWIEKQDLPKNFTFFSYGLADFDGEASFNPIDPAHNRPDNKDLSMYRWKWKNAPTLKLPVRKLSTIMGKLGHDKIDLIKLDIEGTEYSVLRELPPIPQILAELHLSKIWGIPYTEYVQQWLARKYLTLKGYRLMSRNKHDFSFIQ